MTDDDHPKYEAPRGSWTALNDVEPAADGYMYWAILEYGEDGAHSITGYDLEHAVAWEVVRSRNEAMGLERDKVGLWYRPDPEAYHGGIYWREPVPEDFYA